MNEEQKDKKLKDHIFDFRDLNPQELELLAKFDDFRKTVSNLLSDISIRQILTENNINLKCLNLNELKAIPEGYCKYNLGDGTCGLGGKCYITILKAHIKRVLRKKEIEDKQL